MKNLSKTMFGALALVGVSTSVAFAGGVVDNKGILEEENVIHNQIIVDNGIVTGTSNYYINSDGLVLIYASDDGINYNVSEGNLEEILAQIENGTFDMSNPFAIFESDYTKDLYLLVWDGSNLTQSRVSDVVENNNDNVVELNSSKVIVDEDGNITEIVEIETIVDKDGNKVLQIIQNS